MSQDTIQDLRAFSQKVYDLIEAYLEENECTIYAADGVYVDADREPSILSEDEAENPDNFFPLCSLVREDEETMEADAELVKEMAEQYFG